LISKRPRRALAPSRRDWKVSPAPGFGSYLAGQETDPPPLSGQIEDSANRQGSISSLYALPWVSAWAIDVVMELRLRSAILMNPPGAIKA
jgi:hypothetical protein